MYHSGFPFLLLNLVWHLIIYQVFQIADLQGQLIPRSCQQFSKPAQSLRLERAHLRSRAMTGAIQHDMSIDTDSRSEEHTSELQSHSDLVCRLLLEKKKQKQ